MRAFLAGLAFLGDMVFVEATWPGRLPTLGFQQPWRARRLAGPHL